MIKKLFINRGISVNVELEKNKVTDSEIFNRIKESLHFDFEGWRTIV